MRNGFGFRCAVGSPPSPIKIFGSDLVAWYDFADAATLTVSGGVITQANDKSGNGFTLFGAGGTSPAWSSTAFIGHPGATFTGSDILSTNSGTTFGFAGAALCSTFAHVMWPSSLPQTNARLVSYATDADTVDYGSNNSGCLLGLLAGSGSASPGVDLTNSRGGGTTIADCGTIPYYGPQAMMQSQHARVCSIFDGTNTTIYVENIPSTPVAFTANFGGPGTLSIGNLINNNAPWLSGPVKEIVITKNVATSTQRAQMQQWFVKDWAVIVICGGDSIVHAGPTSADGEGYIYQAIPNLGSRYYIDNRAIGGSSLYNANSEPYLGLWNNQGVLDMRDTMFARVPTNKYGQKYVLYFDYSNAAPSYWNGSSFVNSVPTYLTLHGTVAAAAKAANFDKVVTGTVLSRTDGGGMDDTDRDTYNADMRSTFASLNFDALADFASDAIMGVDAAPTVNPTYFNGQVHPNPAGNTRLEPYFTSTITGLGL